uniref:Triosephosphate isomerase n=1 Tax=Chromera velia CCMP2878 TaxID=1169474 RepID=A0A0G4HD20_9ALVE|eukprot:Cvel_26393.t1-p1 / transcript=Cvel_26393.t1 / gene=Cvel_26393 / organism=Chromera_velia_CCMP2878 / gene_product=Triosephosphate isomerase, putative / transcript_product=Triosephosphate isomerase, putative / location=Cvel_scaffold3131:17505-19542(-) / protein_length=231 / sequence_SO=supercontig / SO=protein_coding / is_pseudo=false
MGLIQFVCLQCRLGEARCRLLQRTSLQGTRQRLAEIAQAKELLEWARETAARYFDRHRRELERIELCLCPPFVLVDRVRRLLDRRIAVGAQNVFEACGPLKEGTGVITLSLFREVGCSWIILGHSDSRNIFGETDLLIAEKTVACLSVGLGVNLTVGETSEQRASGEEIETLIMQTKATAERVGPSDWERIVIACEPVWAVGEGAVPCSPEEATQVLEEVRNWLDKNAPGS